MKNIALIQTAFLGDVILTTSLISGLREMYPGATIHFVTTAVGAEVLADLEGVVPHIFFKRDVGFIEGLREIRNKLLMGLQGKRFDLVIAVHRSFRSSIVAKIIPSKTRIGFRTFTNMVLGFKTVPFPKYEEGQHYSTKILSLLDCSVLGDFESTVLKKEIKWAPVLHVSGKSLEFVKQKLGAEIYSNYGVVSPFSSWPTKEWPIERFFDVALSMSKEKGLKMIFCGQSSQDLIKKSSYLFKQFADRGGIGANLIGATTVSDMVALVAHSKIIIANDSAPVHMASTFNIPTVAVFGPTVKRFGFFPMAEVSEVVESPNLNCRPCGLHGARACPKKHFRCMLDVSVSDVVSAATHLLQRTEKN